MRWRRALPSDVRKVSDLPSPLIFFGATPLIKMTPEKFQVSRDCRALYITIVSKDRLPVFQSDKIKIIACQALDEARNSGKFLIFAYVIMFDHMHLLTNCPTTSAHVLRYIKGITGRRVIDYLKDQKYEGSLAKLRHQNWKREHKYSLWQQEKNVFSIFSEAVFMEKVNYIHLNPVRAGLVERATDYRWSSARIWQRCEAEDEPLRMDIDRIQWRQGA
jgi:putative transposase